MGSTTRRGRPRARFPTSLHPTPIRPSPRRTTTETVTATGSVSLELDDIQSGALHERPSPYVGSYVMLRIDDRAAGRELVRRLHDAVDSGTPTDDPARDAWVTVGLTYHGLKALGVPQASLDS